MQTTIELTMSACETSVRLNGGKAVACATRKSGSHLPTFKKYQGKGTHECEKTKSVAKPKRVLRKSSKKKKKTKSKSKKKKSKSKKKREREREIEEEPKQEKKQQEGRGQKRVEDAKVPNMQKQAGGKRNDILEGRAQMTRGGLKGHCVPKKENQKDGRR